MNNNSKVTIYGTGHCSDCARSKEYLDSIGIAYNFIDIENNKKAMVRMLELNNGLQLTPTILFNNGDILVEPTNNQIEEKIKSIATIQR